MRSAIIYAMLTSVSIGCASSAGPNADTRSLFSIQSTVAEAIEGGPLIIKATLIYQGQEPLEFYQSCASSHVVVEVPANWEFQSWVESHNGPLGCAIEMKKGEKLSETLFLHQLYSNIPKGKVHLRLSWPVHELNNQLSWPIIGTCKNDRLLACPSTTLTIDVPPADAAHLAVLRKKLEQIMNQPGRSEQDCNDVFNHLRGTKHSALTPVVWRMIENPPSSVSVSQLIHLLYESSEPSHHATDARFVQLVGRHAWEHAPFIFKHWRAERTILPATEFTKLTNSNHLSTKVLTYVTFPRQCDKAWTGMLSREVRDLGRALPLAQFARLLRDLDDDSFIVREKASTELERQGERVEAHLKRALQTPLSPEAKRRARSALDRIAAVPRPTDCDRTIRYLVETVRTPEADAILGALAEGDPNLRLTKYVKTALKERQKLPSSSR